MTKKKIAIVLAVAILLVGAFAVFSNIQKEKDEWSAFLCELHRQLNYRASDLRGSAS